MESALDTSMTSGTSLRSATAETFAVTALW
jgi:hypothetical protein